MGGARPPAHADPEFSSGSVAHSPDPAARYLHAVTNLELGGHSRLASRKLCCRYLMICASAASGKLPARTIIPLLYRHR
jgi:hypothetical protein